MEIFRKFVAQEVKMKHRFPIVEFENVLEVFGNGNLNVCTVQDNEYRYHSIIYN